jgi:cystathionine beta-synthase
MKQFSSLLDTIGNTPLVPIALPVPAKVFGKMEYINPGGSIKDRPARYIVQTAEQQGLIQPGDTIVLPSSGNMGIALALIGVLKGYKIVITLSEKTAPQKIGALRALNAEVVLCPSVVYQDDSAGYVKTAERIAHERNGFLIDQFHNLMNQDAHYHDLGPEIWRDTDGTITHFVASAGTGGTVSGVGRFLKEQNADIIVHAADSAHSFFSTGGHPKPYKVEAFGVDSITDVFDQSIVDHVWPLVDEDVFRMTRDLCQKHGHLVGFSSGAAALAVTKMSLTPSDVLVFPLCDSGRSYLDKIFPSS